MKKKISIIALSAMLAASPLIVTACGNNTNDGDKSDVSSEVINETCKLTAKRGEGYYVRFQTVGAGLVFDENDECIVKKGSSFALFVEALPGYTQANCVLKANGVVVTREFDWSYKLTVNEDTVITVSNVEKLPEQYNVRFVENEGYSFTEINYELVEGVAKVTEEKVVTFKVVVNEGYDDSGMLVKANNRVLNLQQGGLYSFVPTEDTVVSVEGIVREAEKCNVTFTEGTGFRYIDVSETLVDGVARVSAANEIYFTIEALPGYTVDNAVVLANGVEVTKDPEDGHYYVTVNEDTTITVNGVSTRKYTLTMQDTLAYSFTEVTGVTLVDGTCEVSANTTISFKLNIKEGFEVSENFAVKVNGETLVKDGNGVYTFSLLADTTIVVNGVVRGETLVVDGLLDKAGVSSDDVCTEKGYTKTTEYTGLWSGTWDSFTKLADVELAKYDELRFAIKTNGKFFEFELNDSIDHTAYATNAATWVEYKLVREDTTPLGETNRTFNYRLYKDGAWTNIALEDGAFLSDMRIRLGGDAGSEGHFLISELRGRENPNYVIPSEKITFVQDETIHHTITIDGQVASNCYGDLGEEFTFQVVPEEGYSVSVSYNNQVLTVGENNTYSFTVGRENVVVIEDKLVANNLVLADATYNDATFTSTLTSTYGQKKAFAAVENINEYESLSFSVKFETTTAKGYLAIGDISELTGGGEWDFLPNRWYSFTLTKTAENEFLLTTSSTVSGFPTDGRTVHATDGNLSNVGMCYTDGKGATAVATFTQLYGVKA